MTKLRAHIFVGSVLALAAGLNIPANADDAASAAAKPADTTAVIPVKEFVKKPNMRSPRLSRDGTKLAYLAGRDGKELLVMLDLADPKAAPKIVVAAEEARESGERTLGGYRWVGNRYILMTVLLRENLGGGLGDFSRLVAYDVETGKTILQAWDGAGGSAADILHIDHIKGSYLLARTSVKERTDRWSVPEVVRVDVATGKYSYEQRTNPEVEDWAADGKGVVRVGYSYNGDNGKLRMMYRSTEKDL